MTKHTSISRCSLRSGS